MSGGGDPIRGSARGRWLVGGALLASTALVAAYLALGGSSYEPTASADPCAPREWRSPDGIEESAHQFALSALDGAACELGVTREELAVALATDEARAEFAAERGIGDDELETAVRAGLRRAIDDAEAAGALGGLIADGLRAVAARAPVDEGIDLISGGAELFADAEGLVGGVMDQIEELLP